MAIYRGPGGSGDAVNDSSSETRLAVEARDAALAAQAAAEAAEAAALVSETNAATSETNASTSATSASSAASAAHTYATNADTSATNAASSASTASTAATNAASSASAASTSASGASTSATNAANSASAAATSATNAASSATAAASSASSASTSASTATTKASEASTSATNAASSATSASGSASTATTQAGIATTQATNASNSATSASTSASNAATSATNAASSASSASTSATNAASSATAASSAQSAAEAARDATLAAYDSFDDRYLGAKTSDPSLDNDGNALVAGALYFNSTDGVMKLWTGSIWTAAYVSGAGVLLQANNLSDLSNVASARTNLGVAIGTNVQAWDADLDAIAAIAGTSGLLKKTAANTWSLDTNTYLTSAVTSVTGTAPIVSSGGNTPAISIPAATSLVNGYLSSTDWSTFNGKQAALVSGTNIKTVNGTTLLGSGDLGTIGVAYGGTGQTSFTAGQIHYGSFNTSSSLYFDGTNLGITSGRVDLSNAYYLTGRNAVNTLSLALIGRNASDLVSIDPDGYNTTFGGNVGIGTSSPSTRLHVKSADNTNASLIVENLNNTNGILQFGSASSSYAIFGGAYQGQMTYNTGAGTPHIWWVGGAEKMRLDSSGNLGLGVTPSAWTSYTAAQIGTVGSVGSANFGGGNQQTILLNNAYHNAGFKYLTSSVAAMYRQLGGEHQWHNAPSGIAGNAITFTQAMTLDASGQLGIGLTSPSTKLHVYQGTAGTGAANIAHVNGNGIIVNPSYNYYDAYNHIFRSLSGTTTYATIDNSGRLGIGAVPAASYTGHSNFQIGAQAILAANQGLSTTGQTYLSHNLYFDTGGNWAVFNTSSANEGAAYQMADGIHAWYNSAATTGTPTVTERMRISSAGGLSVGTTADPGAGAIYATGSITANYSDDRLKTKLGNIENALAKVKTLSGFYYEANQTAQDLGYQVQKEVGVSAQEMQAVLPEVVKPAPIDQKYLTVQYERIVPLLIEAIKELDSKIEELRR